ncbi:MAG: PAS domain-containing protein [Gammaproteobacteria bacterium]|nr:PAS domain-containing protein [Gammaproteobacteria bacterium]
MANIDFQSLLKEETSMRWGFLDQEPEACAVVTTRMELVYLNYACQSLVPVDWFSRRCFEVLPHEDALCALDCPTIHAVQTAQEITVCEETLRFDDGSTAALATAVIPLKEPDDIAKAVLLFRKKDLAADADAFTARLLEDAQALLERMSD